MKKKAKKKKPAAKPVPATLLGYTIVNECACGEKVEPYARQEMRFDHAKQQWYRLCEGCIEKKKRTKKPMVPGPQPLSPMPSLPPQIGKVLEITT